MVLGIENWSRKQRVEAMSFGIGGVIVLAGMLMYMMVDEQTRPIAASFFLAGLIVAFLPYGLYTYFHDRKYDKMEQEFPAFLRNLSESIKSGMSLPEAWRQAAKTDYGRLNVYVEHAAHQLSWGVPFPEVMERLSDKLEGSELMRRSNYIILQSYESGGRISETLDAIASNAAMIKEAEKEKRSVLIQQVYIIYAIHFLFLGIIIALYLLLGDFLLEIGNTGGSGSQAFGSFQFGQVKNFCKQAISKPICTLCPLFGFSDQGSKMCYYESLFLIMLVVEGVLNGIVAGEVLESKMSAGVKHSLFMGVVGFLIYILAVNMFG